MTVWFWGALMAASLQGDANVTLVLEFDESKLRVQENWQFNLAAAAPPGAVRLKLPQGAKTPGFDQGGDRFALTDADRVVVNTGQISSGMNMVVFHYGLATSGSSTRITWQPPDVPVVGARIAFPVLDGLSTNLGKPSQVRSAAGVNFELHDKAKPFEGGPFTLRLDGLPSTLTWPRYAAAIACVVLALVTVVFLFQPHTVRESVDPLSVRKQRLLESIRQLDAQPLEDAKAHRARREELLAQLAGVLRRESSGEVG